jgi:hypothetical protein
MMDEEQEELWDELYAQASAELDEENYEHPVKPDALIAGHECNRHGLSRPVPGEGCGVPITWKEVSM